MANLSTSRFDAVIDFADGGMNPFANQLELVNDRFHASRLVHAGEGGPPFGPRR